MEKKKFLMEVVTNGEILDQLKTSGKSITRNTFKKYVDNKQMDEVEKSLGYSNRHGGLLAKENTMIKYWKFPVPETGTFSMVYQESPGKIYIFA